MEKQTVIFRDLGNVDYQAAWDYQEKLLKENVRKKSEAGEVKDWKDIADASTKHYLLFVEHPPVYTLGKSGNKENVLLMMRN